MLRLFNKISILLPLYYMFGTFKSIIISTEVASNHGVMGTLEDHRCMKHWQTFTSHNFNYMKIISMHQEKNYSPSDSMFNV